MKMKRNEKYQVMRKLYSKDKLTVKASVHQWYCQAATLTFRTMNKTNETFAA